MKSSYLEKDVSLLLTDITGLVEPLPTEKREVMIQSGIHYSEMLPLEYEPTEKYLEIYEHSLTNYSKKTADAVKTVAEKIIKKKGKEVVLVSLARAGTPIGILIKRYIESKYRIEIPHYSISIIRGKGIDRNALTYLLTRYKSENLQFVDGWIGKGAILGELKKELVDYPDISDDIAVLSDAAYICSLVGTHEDFLIPSSCLNSTVSGLISRTFLRKDIIGEKDFHGAVYYENLLAKDKTYEFINKVETQFDFSDIGDDTIEKCDFRGLNEVKWIAQKYNVSDLNLLKPGIGETTRVLLRRIPWKILINEKYKDSPELRHIFQLAKEKKVEVISENMNCYKCIGMIKKMNDV